jgi:hypothetical protein
MNLEKRGIFSCYEKLPKDGYRDSDDTTSSLALSNEMLGWKEGYFTREAEIVRKWILIIEDQLRKIAMIVKWESRSRYKLFAFG